MKTQNICCDLLVRINDLRKIMILTGMSKGLNDLETLKYSEELDKLILKYQMEC